MESNKKIIIEQKLYTSINEFKKQYYSKNEEPVNELFGLGDKIKNSFSKFIGGNISKINKTIETFKDEYNGLLEEKTAVIAELENEDSEDIVKKRLEKLEIALDKKKELITQKLHNNLKSVVKNDREQTYSDLQENAIKLELINKEIEMLSKLKVKTDMSTKLDKLKKDTQNQIQKDNKKLKELESNNKDKDSESKDGDKSDLKIGDRVKYKKEDGEETENKLVKINNDTITIKTDTGNTFDIDKKNIIK